MSESYVIRSPIGNLRISDNNEAITEIALTDASPSEGSPSLLQRQACCELMEYFEGKRKIFSVPFVYKGTDFQEKVWKELCRIPYGETRSYGDIAKLIGNPGASRAVGGACSKNNIIIVVPCHRVTGADGSLTGFACGLDIKKRLLELEKGF